MTHQDDSEIPAGWERVQEEDLVFRIGFALSQFGIIKYSPRAIKDRSRRDLEQKIAAERIVKHLRLAEWPIYTRSRPKGPPNYFCVPPAPEDGS